MAINTSKVVVAGLAAGVVQNVLGLAGFGLLLSGRFNAEMDAVVPGLSTKMATTANTVMTVVSSFVIGWLLVWLYAAMRPRFGPGMKTAAYAALVVWLCGDLFYLDNYQSGMMSVATYCYAAVVSAVTLVASAGVGGMLYKEEGSATT